jgi:hypothetical protein
MRRVWSRVALVSAATAWGGEIGAGVQAGEAERAGWEGIQVAVGPGEYGPDGGAGVAADVEQVQSLLLVGEFVCQAG